ncbi:trigger factor [Candidatus Absconditicoccus praedator]|uniref:trigger factor n=1 Tax=Candidatus Absconditicoccus praedator TaxID=2735562 RepID=UPI001E3A194E|nr:trigger factor [Candidatus Absconditicoccus praedator]UFX83458.1 hypothetical protein HLG78_05000 [Candidatus Absconditicoccus praedator]
MKYELTKGNNSNYEISITIPNEDSSKYKEKILKKIQQDMEVPGFRKGHAPLEMVEEKANPEYIKMGIYEEIVNEGLKKIIEENPNIKFIGQIYNVNDKSDDKNTTITFNLDEYPQVEVKNDNWKAAKIEKVDDSVTEEEIQQTLGNLQKQYAQYDDVEEMTQDTVAKVKFDFLDENEQKLDNGTAFIGKEDMDEHHILQELFVGKKKGEVFNSEYQHDKLPHILHYHKEGNPTNIKFEMIEIKKVQLPEMTDEKIQELFNNEVKNLDELRERITEIVQKQKFENGLVNQIENFIKSAEESMEVVIPKTIIDEEVKTRMKSLEKRFGGEEGLKKYMDSISEEERNNIHNDVRKSSKESLGKFFILKEISNQLGISDQIDWKTPLDAEKKVYEKLVESNNNSDKKGKNANSTKKKSESNKSDSGKDK